MIKYLILIVLFVCFSLYFTIYLYWLYKNIQKNIKISVAPHFMNISPSVQQFKDLIIALFILKKHINKIALESNLESKFRPVTSAISKIENILKIFGFEIVDYTGQKYNDGMNIDIINTVKSDIKYPIIKETIEPSIIYNGELISKAKVIKEINGDENA